MSNENMIRKISDYQILQLREMFLDEVIIESMARIDETAELFITCRGGRYEYDGIVKSKKIPYYDPAIVQPNKTDDTEFEIIQPKQIDNGKEQ